MIRTSLAFLTLFGGLLLFTSCLEQTSAQERAEPAVQQLRPFQTGGSFRRSRRSAPYARVYYLIDTIDRQRTDVADLRALVPRPPKIDDPVGQRRGAAPSRSAPRADQVPDDAIGRPAAPPEISAEMLELRDKIRRCLAYYFKRPESAGSRSPWGIMHTLIAFGVDTEIYARGQKVNAIGWLCWNGSCGGQRLFYTSNGKLYPTEGPGLQGHAGQFLAMLAQSRVKRDYPIRVDGQAFTVQDLVEHEQRTCRAGTELTFKLIGLSHYVDSDARWTNEDGQPWSVSRLIRQELAQPVLGAACGGTHRMMGFSYAVNRRRKQGKPITGQWRRAEKYVRAYHDYTFKLQNADGSFSTSWFEGRSDWGGLATRLRTTGHILEWLVYSLPDEQLFDPRVVKAVNYLTDLMLNNQSYPWEIGPRGHALHALVLYDQRVFGAQPGQGGPQIASSMGPRAGEN